MKKLLFLLPLALYACGGQNKGTCGVGQNLMTVWCNSKDCEKCALFEDGKRLGLSSPEKLHNRVEGKKYKCECED